MADLSIREKDLLERVQDKPELRPLFFRRVKGLKWFTALEESGYFEPSKIPPPRPAQETGYIDIPRWEALEYLVNTAPDLSSDQSPVQSRKFIDIIIQSTNYAKENKFGNYHVWWQFSEILRNIPSRFLSIEIVSAVDYWLSDRYDTNLLAENIGLRWLPSLLAESTELSLSISHALLDTLFKITFVDETVLQRTRRVAKLRFDSYHAQKILKKTAHTAGGRLGPRCVDVFHTNLVSVFKELKIDSWSALWQPAIEDHEQNAHHDDAENILVMGYRDLHFWLFGPEPQRSR